MKHNVFRATASVLLNMILALLCLSGCHTQPNASDPRNLTAMISAEGSDTMVSLLKSWADAFKTHDPEIPISITSADTGDGIASLINRTTDVAMASRDLTDGERELAHSKGVHVKKYTVARDAIAIIANSANPVSTITLEQLEKIYMGQLSNWSQLGGKDLSIEGLSREKSSGTYEYFQSHVLHGKDNANSAIMIASNKSIIEKVKTDPGAIAYVGLGHAAAAGNKVKILAIKLMATSKAVSPSKSSMTDDYPLGRPLIIFTDENPKHSVEKFVNFCLSDEGQKLVAATGYVAIR
jgi:phosphate transport system substrate-binding protein